MKKFIITVKGYALDGTIRYVTGGTDYYCELSPYLNQAKQFESIEAAQAFMSNYSVGDNAIVEYKEITCIDVLNKEEK